MKKRDKKLMLSKETLRTLLDRELTAMVGGTSYSDCQSCDPLYTCPNTFAPLQTSAC